MRIVLATSICIALLAAGPAQAGFTFSFTPIVVEGDNVAPLGAVTSIDNLAVNNSGSWLVEVDTNNSDTNTDGALLRDGAVYLREGAAVAQPPGANLDSFDSVNLSNTGHSGWNFFLGNTGSINNDSGIYRDTGLVIQESNLSTSPAFSPGTPYIGFFDSKINDGDQIFVVASIDDPAIATTVDRALVRLEMSGGTLLSETVLAKEADVLAGQVESVADFGTGPHQTAFDNGGNALYFADLNGNTVTDGVIYLNSTLLAQEGAASPVAGRNYELLSSRGMDLNSSGGYVFKANLDGDAANDEMIVKNGAVLVREGDNLPAIGGNHFTSFGTTSGPVQIDDQGNVLWFGDWDEPNLDKDTGLFLNDQTVIVEGSDIGGMVVDEISNGEDAFQLSDDGHWILFECTLAGGISAAVLVQVFDEPVPTEIADFAALAAEDRVQLQWNLRDTSGDLLAIEVERADDAAGPFVTLSHSRLVPAPAMRFEDTSVEAGEHYWYRLALVSQDGSRTAAGSVEVVTAAIPTALRNAWESDRGVHVQYSVARAGTPIQLTVHDVRGRMLWRAVETASATRVLEARWDRRDLSGVRVPRGVYFVHLDAGGVQQSRKLLLARE